MTYFYKKYNCVLAIIVFAIIIWLILIKYDMYDYFKTQPTLSNVDNKKYNVIGGFIDNDIAADKMATLHQFIIDILRYLKRKYIINNNQSNSTNMKNFVQRILNNYNRDVLYENDPRPGEETSYVMNKGDKFGLCLRDKTPNRNFHDYNTLQFVILHEMTHLGLLTYGHNDEFWEYFRLLLIEAAKSNLYIPVNYAIYPINYCGLPVHNNPYFN